MRELTLLIWLMQLGLNVAVPLAGYILLAVWLRGHFGWGAWVIWVGIILGVVSAVGGLRTSLRALEKLTRDKDKPKSSVPAYNDHD